ncbi:MAG: MarR family transcriptional regulator [Planctomycetota bacterium]
MSKNRSIPDQTRLARETYLNLIRAHDRLLAGFHELFRGSGLTQAQFNVLRILRGAENQRASCQYIGQNLISAVPDVTRLVDRMLAAGLVSRERDKVDRRVVLVLLTEKGRRLVDSLDEPVDALHRRQFETLDPKDLVALHDILEDLLVSHPERRGG